MLNADTGWAERSPDGAVLHTTRGVQHWSVATPQLPSGQHLVAVAFVSATSARALSAGGLSFDPDAAPVSVAFTSWATDDGGEQWSRGGGFSAVQDPGSSWQSSLDFINVDDGWFSANEDDVDPGLGMTLFRTVDGGAHWDQVATLEPAPTPLGSVPCYTQPTAHFISSTTGWLTGGGCATAQFEVTHNGGVTWSPQSIALLGTPYLSLDNPTFMTSQDGVMLGIATGGNGGFVYVTLDGGRIWTPHDTPELWPHAVDFLNANEGWLLSTNTMNAGFPAGLYVTDDGGQRWNTRQSINTVLPTNIVLNGSILDFVSPTLGWTDTFTGNGNDLLQTTDGGHTWRRVTVQIGSS
jgi:photosystem II stability/assembly factor-like uncharacterized protein